MDKRTIKERLLERGFAVTNKAGKSLGVKMIVDRDGAEVGFLSPLECVSKLLK